MEINLSSDEDNCYSMHYIIQWTAVHTEGHDNSRPLVF